MKLIRRIFSSIRPAIRRGDSREEPVVFRIEVDETEMLLTEQQTAALEKYLGECAKEWYEINFQKELQIEVEEFM